jgi:hypothetical protein
MTFATTTVAAQTSISFQVTNVKNPPDTRPTSSFTQVRIEDSTSLQLTQFVGNSILATSEFADIVTRSLSQSVLTISEPSDYTISFKNVNKMPSTAAFRIRYPSTVGVNAASVGTCRVVFSGNTYPMSC